MRALDNSSVGSYIRLFRQSNRHFYPPLAQSAEVLDLKSIQSRFEFGAEDHSHLMGKPTPAEEWSNLTEEQKSASVLDK